MRRSLFCSLLSLLCSVPSAIVLLSSTTFLESAAPAQTVTVPMRSYTDVRAVVAVKVNGAGPYDFVVDTGATATVVDAALFAELGLQPEGSVAMGSATGWQTQVRSTVKEISVGGLAAQDLTVLSVKSLPFGSGLRGVRGILGENFLHHFDVLIDNQHRKIMLDAGGSLADSFGGERLPIAFPAAVEGEEMRYRPMVSVTLASSGTRPVKVLLDSGADNFVLVGKNAQPWARSAAVGVRTVNGSMACTSSEDRLHWGKASSELTLVSCQSPAANPNDHEGNLPTAAFKQILISHAGSYAIVNPAKSNRAPQEIATVGPLAR